MGNGWHSFLVKAWGKRERGGESEGERERDGEREAERVREREREREANSVGKTKHR